MMRKSCLISLAKGEQIYTKYISSLPLCSFLLLRTTPHELMLIMFKDYLRGFKCCLSVINLLTVTYIIHDQRLDKLSIKYG